MTTFIHINYSINHPGVARFERAYASAKNIVRRLQHESTYAAALLVFGALSLIASIYDMPGVTHQESLASFWTRPQAPEADMPDALTRASASTPARTTTHRLKNRLP